MTLEELLNKLIQMGWKPRNIENIGSIQESEWLGYYILTQKDGWDKLLKHSLRDLVSMESGLWQFVCENDLYSKIELKINDIDFIWASTQDETIPKKHYYTNKEYRLMLSSIQEDIPKLLLDNILLPTK